METGFPIFILPFYFLSCHYKMTPESVVGKLKQLIHYPGNNMNYENYDPSFPDQPVVDLYLPIWAGLPAFRSKPAFIWAEDGSNVATKTSAITYGELNESVQSISTQLLLRFQRGDTVVILCSPGLELVEIIFGCQRAGLLCIPIFPPEPSFSKEKYHHHLVRVLSQTKPKAAIAHCDYISRIQQYISLSSNTHKLVQMLQNLTWISTSDVKDNRLSSNVGSRPHYNGCGPNEVYLIQYTSGATGIPKPVLITAGAAVHNVRIARKAYDLHPNSVVVSWLPQFHDCGLQFLLVTIISGATCVLTSPGAFVNRPRLWLELISDFKATCTPVPSFTLPLVVKRGGVDEGTRPISLSSLKNLIIINEPIYKASVDEFIEAFNYFGLNPSCISPSYGLAENCTFVSTAWRCPFSNLAGFPDLPSHSKLLPSARLDSQHEEGEEDMNIVIVNEDTHELLGDGIEGEIWVSSPSNGSGYLGHPCLTREIFQARVSNIVSRCFLRTGDRGIIKGEERYLYVTGRCSDVIELPNNREIHPHYIETAAQNCCRKLLRGGCLTAFEISSSVVLVAEMQRTEKDVNVLRQICESVRKAVLQEEKVELGLIVLVKSGSIPKTTSGKIQRWAAKYMLTRGKMRVVLEMKFHNNNARSFSFPGEIICQEKEERDQGDGREVAGELHLGLASSPNRPLLFSLL